MISTILLSAGLSSRFGSPKALANFNGITVIENLQNMLLKAQIAEIIIVLGANHLQIKPYILKHKKVKLVYNKDYKLGQTSSFKTGLKQISFNSKGIMLLPVDYPIIKEQTINSLVEKFSSASPRILIPTYQKKKGHPPIFSTTLTEEILKLSNDSGINEISRRHIDKTVLFEVSDEGVVSSFNTKEEFIALEKKR